MQFCMQVCLRLDLSHRWQSVAAGVANTTAVVLLTGSLSLMDVPRVRF